MNSETRQSTLQSIQRSIKTLDSLMQTIEKEIEQRSESIDIEAERATELNGELVTFERDLLCAQYAVHYARLSLQAYLKGETT